MAGKFKMSNGTEGMLRGQASPDAFQKSGMPKRSYRTDTEFERQAVKPQKTHENSTGYTSQCADLAMEDVMQQAIKDKMHQSMVQGFMDGDAARLEEEAMRPKDASAADIDEKQDGGNFDDDDLEALRARRRQQMKEAQEKKQKYKQLGHGEYEEIVEEEFLKTVTSSERSVVHFYHRSFEKCKVMDMHLGKCAKKFIGTKFVKLNAEKAPFFVEKLGIRTLPCAIVFVDGVARGRQVGFEALSAGDEFKTVQLAWRLKEWGGLEEDFGPEDEF
eukprot:TRINITY_DN122013_c0_g1_i1.p1 TRINITY_DN122013_c0_g1~~TRINITY_DN122013_c0_g1_i1.p1  ORF type:complete len:274 (-),score=102.28 TRINITY_DN122013_c0_g1_i1:201-1022(-)